MLGAAALACVIRWIAGRRSTSAVSFIEVASIVVVWMAVFPHSVNTNEQGPPSCQSHPWDKRIVLHALCFARKKGVYKSYHIYDSWEIQLGQGVFNLDQNL